MPAVYNQEEEKIRQKSEKIRGIELSYTQFATTTHQDDTHLGSTTQYETRADQIDEPTFKKGIYGDTKYKDDLFGAKFNVVEKSDNTIFNSGGNNLGYSHF